MRVREANLEDAEELYPLAKDLPISAVVEREAFARCLAEVLKDPDHFLRLAEEDGRIVGYILGQKHLGFHANGWTSWVSELYVAPAFRNRRIGQTLMACFNAWARQEECSYVSLATGRANRLYEKIGFVTRAAYYRRAIRS